MHPIKSRGHEFIVFLILNLTGNRNYKRFSKNFTFFSSSVKLQLNLCCYFNFYITVLQMKKKALTNSNLHIALKIILNLFYFKKAKR